MNVFKKLLYIIPAAALAFTMTACTDVENVEIDHVGGHQTGSDPINDPYYVNLREYKAQANNYGRPVAFGWFSNWAPSGVMRKGYLSSVPDSMDIISMWSGAPGRYEITEAQKKDKEFAQKVKGIKLLEVSLLSHLGKGRTPAYIYEEIDKKAAAEGWSQNKIEQEKKFARWDFWGFTSHDLNNTENLNQALAKFAKALCDSLVVSEWDGFDIDWEPGSGFNDSDGTLNGTTIKFLVKEMGKYIGPMSDPEGKGHKLLVIDGLINYFDRECDDYVDYWITQSYGSSRPHYYGPGDTKKLIITENFESGFAYGGQLLNQARWMPENGCKGGVGAYRFDNDYDNTPDYRWMRQAIQINQQVFNEWKASQNGSAEGK